MRLLTGKWALVTGSSRGIGQQIALGLAQRECNVILHGRQSGNCLQTERLLVPFGIKTHSIDGDLGTMEGLDKVINQVKQSNLPVDILYNNAAIQNEWKEIWDISTVDWLETFQINVFSIIQLCISFATGMKQRGYGRIINLTSGIRDIPQLAPYSVSKAAIDKFTQDLAAELRGTNVLVNTLDPGWLLTDMGGPEAMYPVETVLPGALVPALLDDHGPTGRSYSAQDYRVLGDDYS